LQPPHLTRLLPQLPSFLPGCEDLLLDAPGFTAQDFDCTLAEAVPQLAFSDALPLLAQAFDLDTALAQHAEVALASFAPSRIYLRNHHRQGLSGLNDFRLRFYHLEDLAPEAPAFAITRGLAKWFAEVLPERKPCAALAGNGGALREFLAAVAAEPEKLPAHVAKLKLSLRSAERTHVGRVRTNNEDAYLVLHSRLEGVSESSSVFAVADGMGGHNAGELASSLALELLRFYSGLWPLGRGSRQRPTPTLIAEHLQTMSLEIHDSAAGDSALADMGTTLSGIFLTYSGSLEAGTPLVSLTGYVFNVGDSRTFAVGADTHRPLTRDHSYVQQLLDTGAITEEEAYAHPQRNVVLQGLGITPAITPDVSFFRPALDAFTVICSDGLTDLVRAPQMMALAAEAGSADSLADALVDEALAQGGKDNITVIVLQPRMEFA